MRALATPAAALLALAATLAGCASFGRVDSATTAVPGRQQVMVAPSGYLGDRRDGNFVNMDVAIRTGLTERTDLGLRLNFLSAAIDVKVQLRRSADPTRGVDIALAPGAGLGADLTWANRTEGRPVGPQVTLPLLVGINLGNRQLLFAPQLMYQYVETLPAGALNAGATVAFLPKGPGVGLALAIWKALDPRDLDGSLWRGQLVFQPALVMRFGS